MEDAVTKLEATIQRGINSATIEKLKKHIKQTAKPHTRVNRVEKQSEKKIHSDFNPAKKNGTESLK